MQRELTCGNPFQDSGMVVRDDAGRVINELSHGFKVVFNGVLKVVFHVNLLNYEQARADPNEPNGVLPDPKPESHMAHIRQSRHTQDSHMAHMRQSGLPGS